MSPLWTDYRLSLNAEGLTFVAIKGMLGVRKQVHKEMVPLGEPDALAQSIFDLFSKYTLPLSARARVKVVVGEPFVRYMALPWQDGLYHDDDWQVYARHMMGQCFSVSDPDWKISTSMGGYGENVLAAAIDNRMYEAIKAGSEAGARCKLHSVRPLLSHAISRRQFSILRNSYTLVLVSVGYASCAFVKQGQCLAVVSLPFDSNTPLSNMLTDAALMCGVRRPSHSYVVATGSTTLSKEHVAGLGKNAKWLGSADPVLWGQKLTQFEEVTGHGEF